MFDIRTFDPVAGALALLTVACFVGYFACVRAPELKERADFRRAEMAEQYVCTPPEQ